MVQLRPYQLAVIKEVYEAWGKGFRNVCTQLATGAGKTVLFSRILADHKEPSIAIAHRIELVGQISLTLARYRIAHNLIAPRHAIREIIGLHIAEIGRSYIDPHAKCHVAGVDTLIKKEEPWFKSVTLLVQDEGHHPLKENKWGKVSTMFPNAYGLYPTATPCRADGKGLGRHADGVIDKLIVGPSMRDLIEMGYLTDYRIFAPSSDINLADVPITASGDFSPPKLRSAVHQSHIVGDVVAQYLRIAPGKLGVTFAVDIEAATNIAEEFNKRGVNAAIVSSKTPDSLRASIMNRFKRRELLQIVNVDLLGEGVDVPAIEVVSMARPTQSFALYSQQFGRALRPMEGKTHAIIIDHVSNVVRHGLPDAPRTWSLDRRDRKRSTALDAIPLRTCLNDTCLAVYPRIKRICPNCGFYTPPAQRSAPEQVDGDLLELDPLVLSKLRGEIDRLDNDNRIPQHLDPIAQMALAKKRDARRKAQGALRQEIAQWAGFLKDQGIEDSEIYRRFYFNFGVDVLTAQTQGTKDTTEMILKIKEANNNLFKAHIDRLANKR